MDERVREEEVLCLLGGLEALHLPFASPCRSMPPPKACGARSTPKNGATGFVTSGELPWSWHLTAGSVRRCEHGAIAVIGSHRPSSSTPFGCICGSQSALETSRTCSLSAGSPSPMRRSVVGWRISVRSTRVGFAPDGPGQPGDGISTRFSSRSPAGRCNCGGPSTMRVRCSTSWSKPDATKMRHCA